MDNSPNTRLNKSWINTQACIHTNIKGQTIQANNE